MKRLSILALLLTALLFDGMACTTAIISGKYTKDGRPLMWKVRDSDFAQNSLMFFSDGKYSYVGLINSEDADGKQVWGGTNSAGFAIMNSASFNVNLDDTTKKKDLEGYFMRKALQSCATLEEFEALLKANPKPMGLAAHFGVIDAKGGAAFYEVNNYSFTKFDANDPAVAPNGYVLRTNFSFTGKKDTGYGFVRFQTAQELLFDADGKGSLDYQTLIQKFSRCLRNPILNRDYRSEYERIPSGEYFVGAEDLITRNGTSSAIIVRGVNANESPELTTMWTMIGFPNTCIALPVWVKGGNNLPKMLVRDEKGNSPLNRMSLQLMEQCFPIKRSGGDRYLQISKLFNLEKTGIVQKIEQNESIIFKKTEENLRSWTDNKMSEREVVQYYKWLDEQVESTYTNQLGITNKQ